MVVKAPEIDGQISDWNEANFKMFRLHEIQQEINKCNLMPLSRHFITNEWNYIILFRCISVLYAEGNAKYKQIELDECNKLKSVIKEHLRVLPPHTEKHVAGKSTKQVILNNKNWEMLEKLLEEYEFKVRLYNDKHGLSTQNKESMDGRSILR